LAGSSEYSFSYKSALVIQVYTLTFLEGIKQLLHVQEDGFKEGIRCSAETGKHCEKAKIFSHVSGISQNG
jgi:hypothetical protein